MISYGIQVIVFQFLLLKFYDLFLKKETFFQLNRIYLLVAPILSFLIPLMEFSWLQGSINTLISIELPEILLSSEKIVTTTSFLSITIVLWVIWFVGIGISLYVFINRLLKINNLKKTGITKNSDGFKIILLPETTIAFTFLKTIFLGENLSQNQTEEILLHEKIHAQQLHTVDLLFYELLKVIFWFNPLFNLFQKRLSIIQEYIADEAVTRKLGAINYCEVLLSQVFQTEKISFINTFFNQSLIKKRIVMLQKSKSTKHTLIKYLMVFPLLGIMIISTSCLKDANKDQAINSQTSIYQNKETQEKELKFSDIDKVPIFPGCESKTNEETKKCFTQNVAKHVLKEFNSKIASAEITGKQRIVVNFIIDANGSIRDVTAKADFKELQDEAIRVAKQLPKMIPGEHKGKKVAVQFALPILFEI